MLATAHSAHPLPPNVGSEDWTKQWKSRLHEHDQPDNLGRRVDGRKGEGGFALDLAAMLSQSQLATTRPRVADRAIPKQAISAYIDIVSLSDTICL